MKAYEQFLNKKIRSIENIGFQSMEMNKNLFDFQKHIVDVAVRKGRYAVFADCGLGKTIMQLETASQIVQKTNKNALILCPLSVVKQTEKEANKFSFDLDKITLTNYENIHNLNTNDYEAIILDESSILKNFEGKRKKQIFDLFGKTKYKFCFTATPSPNDPMEIGNHSEFLNAMTRLEMLATYFINDMNTTQKWRLKGHAIEKFYQFISDWAVMLSNPKDIGYEMKGYELSGIEYIEHQIETARVNNGLLFNDIAVSATNFNQELKRTQDERIAKASEIANSSNENYIVWVKQNEESKLAAEAINGAVEVRGSDKPEEKAEKLLGFANNEFRVLVTKPKIAQYGLNYQNCHNQIFMSLDFSFEALYQSIRRSYRFGQKNKVNAHLITTDTMQNVISSIKEKEWKFKEMQKLMIKHQTLWNTKQLMATV